MNKMCKNKGVWEGGLFSFFFFYIMNIMNNAIIEQKIQELPDNIRSAVENFDWSSQVLAIAHKYHLQIDEIKDFRDEILLVVVGITPAQDFEKKIMRILGISREQAEAIVLDANELIFSPLQKMAFSEKENQNQEEKINQEKIHQTFSSEGIHLISEEEMRDHPHNELQDLANELLEEKIEKKDENEEVSHSIHNSFTQEENPLSKKEFLYHEPITEEDLKGISEHRIDTSILHQKKPQEVFQKKKDISEVKKKLQVHDLDKHLFQNTHISQHELVDVSPSEEEQIKERGEFLKHIGAV